MKRLAGLCAVLTLVLTAGAITPTDWPTQTDDVVVFAAELDESSATAYVMISNDYDLVTSTTVTPYTAPFVGSTIAGEEGLPIDREAYICPCTDVLPCGNSPPNQDYFIPRTVNY